MRGSRVGPRAGAGPVAWRPAVLRLTRCWASQSKRRSENIISLIIQYGKTSIYIDKNEPAVYSQPVLVHIRGGLPLCVVFLVTMFSTVFIICLSEMSSIRLERYDFNFTFSAFTRG